MVRKADDALERFGRAAMELFRVQGYTNTTVPQIAAAAGLTERTFYRYFVDKPEVLFWRAGRLEEEVVEAVDRADPAKDPFSATVDALEDVGSFFESNRVDVVARQAVVAEHLNFQERELMKMQQLASAISEALQRRGVIPAAARMAAEVGVAVWKVAIRRWSADAELEEFGACFRRCVGDVRSVVTGGETRI